MSPKDSWGRTPRGAAAQNSWMSCYENQELYHQHEEHYQCQPVALSATRTHSEQRKWASFIHYFILFLAVLGPHRFGLSLVVMSRGYSLVVVVWLSLWWLFLLQSTVYKAGGLQWLWHMGLVSQKHVGSSQIRDPTHVACIGRQILNHRTTKEIHTFTDITQIW